MCGKRNSERGASSVDPEELVVEATNDAKTSCVYDTEASGHWKLSHRPNMFWTGGPNNLAATTTTP